MKLPEKSSFEAVSSSVQTLLQSLSIKILFMCSPCGGFGTMTILPSDFFFLALISCSSSQSIHGQCGPSTQLRVVTLGPSPFQVWPCNLAPPFLCSRSSHSMTGHRGALLLLPLLFLFSCAFWDSDISFVQTCRYVQKLICSENGGLVQPLPWYSKRCIGNIGV